MKLKSVKIKMSKSTTTPYTTTTYTKIINQLVFHGHPIRYYILGGENKTKCYRVWVRKKNQKSFKKN